MPYSYAVWMEQNGKWRTSGLRVIKVERIIKDNSVHVFVLSSVKLKVDRKTISEEIGWVFSDEKTEIMVNIQQSRPQNSK